MTREQVVCSFIIPATAAIFSLPTGGPMPQEITLVINIAKVGAWVALAAAMWRVGRFTITWLQETTIYLAETRATTGVVRDKHPLEWDERFTEQMATKQGKSKTAAAGK